MSFFKKTVIYLFLLLSSITYSQSNESLKIKKLIAEKKYPEAISFIENELILGNKKQNNSHILTLKYYKGLIAFHQEKFLNATVLCKDSKTSLLENFTNNKAEKQLLIDINDLLIHIYNRTDKLQQAHKVIIENLGLIQPNNYLKKTRYLNYLAYIKTSNHNYNKAIIYIDKAQEYEREFPSTEMLQRKANTKNLLGIIYYEAKEYEKSVLFFNEAYEICKKYNNDIGELRSLLNLGLVYYDMGRKKTAKKTFEKIILIHPDLKKDLFITECYLFLSKIALDSDNYSLAKKYNNSALALSKKVQSEELILRSLILQLNLSNDILEKDDIATQIINLEKNIPAIDLKLKIFDAISGYYEKSDSLFKALKYKKLYSNYSDSLTNKIKTLSVKTTSYELNYLNTKKNLELIKEQNALKKKKYTFYFIVITSLVIFLIFFIYNQKKIRKNELEINRLKKEKLQNNIIQKEKDISTFAMHIDEKNKLLVNIKNKIKQIPTINNNISSLINEMIIFINNDINLNNEKIQFYSKVDESKNSFLIKINKLHPSLTVQEKKIASLVKLGLSSKQIASQLNITKASADNYRTSLKRKMKVTKEVKLYDFLKNL